MGYKLWINEFGVLKHIENLGGVAIKKSSHVYEVYNLSASKLRDMRGVFVISAPRTQIERAYLDAVQTRYGKE